MIKYSDSGVDISKIGNFRNELISRLEFNGRWKIGVGIGHYAGLIEFNDYYLALHTDGVGTKTILAMDHRYFSEIGYDLVGMNVNDLASMNIEPIAMVDYIASSTFDLDIAAQIGDSLNSALKFADISIVGGETASMPDLINGIDISGTVMGIVERSKLIDGSRIDVGDEILGIRSSGFHSNGFSLIRKILKENDDLENETINGEKLWKLLLRGTRIYSKLISDISSKYNIKGMAHITGGGFTNLLRLKKLLYRINYTESIPELINIIIEKGNIDMEEAFRTFNMGIGFILVADKNESHGLLNEYAEIVKIGEVDSGSGIIITPYNIKYSSYY